MDYALGYGVLALVGRTGQAVVGARPGDVGDVLQGLLLVLEELFDGVFFLEDAVGDQLATV